MDIQQIASANTPSTAPTDPSGVAASVAPDDDATQTPLTFKALLLHLKALKLGPTNPLETPIEEPAAAGELLGVTSVDPALITAVPGLPAALVPGAPTTDVSIAPQTGESPTSAESALARPRTPELLLGEAPLQDGQITAKDLLAATNIAGSGEKLPQAGDASRISTSPGSATTTPPLAAAPQPARTTVPGTEFGAAPGTPQAVETHSSTKVDALTAAPPTAHLTTAVQQPSSVAPSAAAQISTPVASPGWGTELGQHMIWMVGQKQQVAELHLNPPHLGPLDITLTMDGMETTAVFTSPHGAVRDAIVAELPRLREVLADSGITLGNASVTSDNSRDGLASAPHQPQRELSSAMREANDGRPGERPRDRYNNPSRDRGSIRLRRELNPQEDGI